MAWYGHLGGLLADPPLAERAWHAHSRTVLLPLAPRRRHAAAVGRLHAGARDAAAHGRSLLVVVLRRSALGRTRKPRVHRVHRHGRAHRRRGLRPRDARPPAADAVRAARGRRPQQPQPGVLPGAPVRVLGSAQRLPLPAQPPQPDALPRVGRAVGRRWLGSGAHGPARHRLRARLHIPEPGRGGRPALPVHARSLLGAVLHLDDRRAPLDPTEDADPQPFPEPSGRRRHAARAPVCEVLRHAGRLDPDGAVRRAPGLVQQLAVLRSLEGRSLLRGRRTARSARSPTCRCASTSSTASSDTPRHTAAPGRWTSRRTARGRRWWCTRRSSAPATRSGMRAGMGGTGRHGRSRARGARCSATTTRASRSTTRTPPGWC